MIVQTLINRVTRLFQKDSPRTPRHLTRRFRPQIEYLSERIVPAVATWQGPASPTGAWETPANWDWDNDTMDGVNYPGDTATRTTDGAKFDSTSTPCNLTTNLAAPLASFEVTTNYHEQISLGGNVDVKGGTGFVLDVLVGQDAVEGAPGRLGNVSGIQLGAEAAVKVAANGGQHGGAEQVIQLLLGLGIAGAGAVEQVEELSAREQDGSGHG
jgi:hypothetical protein